MSILDAHPLISTHTCMPVKLVVPHAHVGGASDKGTCERDNKDTLQEREVCTENHMTTL